VNGSSEADRGVLAGLKVVELGHIIAGPYCGMLFADQGAEVIKVEPPQGDQSRAREPKRTSDEGSVAAYFASLNRRKKAIVLDLKSQGGIEVFHQLITDADVFITNMRSGALDRLGIHPVSLRERYPSLIVANISGFGMFNSGEDASRAGLAMVAEALSGATGLTQDRSGRPVWCGFGLGDIAAATTAHSAILLALRQRDQTGQGRLIDLSLTECMLPFVSPALSRIQTETEEVVSSKNKFGDSYLGVPYGTFAASDGFYSVGVNRDEVWARLCRVMGRPELGDDPRYATYRERARRKSEVQEIMENWSTSLTREEVVQTITSADVPVAPVLTVGEVLEFKLFCDRGAYVEVDDGIGGTYTQPTDPSGFAISERAWIPRLDEHRNSILHDLGMQQAQIESLAHGGAFGPAGMR
jgi:crotonobetainyl-CoA:carnitine CoA-transferase CaiB-like acyl-CoA transferase